MVTRAASAVLLLVLAAGCAAQDPEQAGAPAPSPSSSDVVDLPLPSTEPSAGKPAGSGAQTLTGTVSAGVEPNCLLLNAAGAAHLLIFDNPAMRSDAAVGKKVTVVGRSDPSMMSTCQQGVPFIVTAVHEG
jgi:hypothetical protein